MNFQYRVSIAILDTRDSIVIVFPISDIALIETKTKDSPDLIKAKTEDSRREYLIFKIQIKVQAAVVCITVSSCIFNWFSHKISGSI